MRARRILAALLCLSICLAAMGIPALAADETLDVTYVEITGDGFVADAWLGVEAIYNLNGLLRAGLRADSHYAARRAGDCGERLLV